MSESLYEAHHLYTYSDAHEDHSFSKIFNESDLMPTSATTKSIIRAQTKSNIASFDGLESRIEIFDSIKFPVLKSPLRNPRKIKVKRMNSNIDDSPSLNPVHRNYKIPKSLYPSKRPRLGFKLSSSYDSNIGPGDYNPISRSFTPGGIFSIEARFETNLQEKVEVFLRQKRIKNRSIFLSNKIYERNMDMDQYSLENKEKSFKKKQKIKKAKEEIAKLTKKKIDFFQKENKISKLNEKMQRNKYREKKVEGQQVMKSWIILSIIAGIQTSCWHNFDKRKKLRERSRNHLIFLFNIMRVIGRIRILLSKARWSILIKALKKNSSVIKNWLAKRRKLYLNMLSSVTDKVLPDITLFELMMKFHRIRDLIQAGVLSIIKIRISRIFALSLLWDKFETSVIQDLRKYGKIKYNDKSDRFIPQNIKEEYIKKYFALQAKAHIENIKQYNILCQEIDKEKELNIKEIEFEQMFNGKPITELKDFTYPKRPVFMLYSNNNSMKKYISQLLNTQLHYTKEESYIKSSTLKSKIRQPSSSKEKDDCSSIRLKAAKNYNFKAFANVSSKR
ncbi:unnamed protein product [Blepharisma stoltei]|uniref:IQ calmodulin-binding motif family protein n=1 Tax=Blepharisma stoltei TaxID=1481888 RepID=A0AAU9I6H5_9CILI|nr:unnamed protein product [Blepharisma stoltei]